MRATGILLMAAGLIAATALRACNLDMAEGRLAVAYWPWWLLIAVVSVAGFALALKEPKRPPPLMPPPTGSLDDVEFDEDPANAPWLCDDCAKEGFRGIGFIAAVKACAECGENKCRHCYLDESDAACAMCKGVDLP